MKKLLLFSLICGMSYAMQQPIPVPGAAKKGEWKAIQPAKLEPVQKSAHDLLVEERDQLETELAKINAHIREFGPSRKKAQEKARITERIAEKDRKLEGKK